VVVEITAAVVVELNGIEFYPLNQCNAGIDPSGTYW